MAKSFKNSPIKKTYPDNFKTMESSLSSQGFVRSPGTNRYLMPKKEADGRYRTGLDTTARYLLALPEEVRESEIKFIEQTLKVLKSEFPELDFGPRSKVWNVFSDSPFKATHIPLSNKDVIFHTENLQDLLNYCWVRVHPDIAKSLESFNRGDCPECQYYMANDEAENKVIFSKKKRINKAIMTFEALTPSKKKQIARLMGLPITDDSTEEAVYNAVDNVLKEPEFKTGDFKNLSTISVFEDLVNLTDDRLHVKDLIEQAIRHNVYRTGTGDTIKEGSEVVAASKAELVDYLLDEKNQKELLALESKIKQKKLVII
jgi:hypothetical protein